MKPHLKWTLITGTVLTLGGPIVGACATVLGMMQAFAVLGKEGAANMTGMSSAISNVLIFTVAGIIVGGIGVVVLLIGLILWLNAKPKPSAHSPTP